MNKRPKQAGYKMEENKEVTGQDQISEEVSPSGQEKLSNKEINIVELRASKQQAEKERDEMAQIIRGYETKSKERDSEEEDVPLKEDDLVEGKHLTKLGRKFKNLESKLAKQEEQNRQAGIEAQLRSKYSDFDSVVCGDNFNALKEKNPIIARAISSSTDLFAAGTLAYEEIKRSVVVEPNKYEKDHSLAHENFSKPRPLASVSTQQGESPLDSANAFANGLTPTLIKKLRQQMEDARKAA